MLKCLHNFCFKKPKVIFVPLYQHQFFEIGNLNKKRNFMLAFPLLKKKFSHMADPKPNFVYVDGTEREGNTENIQNGVNDQIFFDKIEKKRRKKPI